MTCATRRMRSTFHRAKGRDRVSIRSDFGYAESRTVLRDINLSIAPNQIVALVGGTGAGKSTLLSLVPRFYDPTTGVVTLDGRDVREITKKSLRAQIAIVLQDTLLFSTTVRENIAYGRPDATEEEIRRSGAARAGGRIHSANAAGIRQPGRRTRRAFERRSAAAHRNRARISEECADSAARRTDFRARSHAPKLPSWKRSRN